MGRFSVCHFLIKITSRSFIAYIVTSAASVVFLSIGLLSEKDFGWFVPLIIFWGVVSVLYIGGNVLIDALAKMAEKASLTVNQNNTISANIGGK